MDDMILELCEEIDVVVFSGDNLYKEGALEEFEEYLGRWNRKVQEIKNQASKEFRKDADPLEIKALQLSLSMWEWLKENPTKRKIDYPAYTLYNISSMRGNCPLCDYYEGECDYKEESPQDITSPCPLFPKGCVGSTIKGVYGEWRITQPIDEHKIKLRKDNATIIYNLIKEKLDSLRKNA